MKYPNMGSSSFGMAASGLDGCVNYPNVDTFGFGVGAAVLDRLHKISECGYLCFLVWGPQR